MDDTLMTADAALEESAPSALDAPPAPARISDDSSAPLARSTTACGVGARVERKEDDRFLRGRGRYVGDIKLPGMREVAFVRSSVAHALLGRVDPPQGSRDPVFQASDLHGVKGIEAIVGLPGYKRSVQPVLARDKVRHVGEPIAACVADSRAAAEDLADAVSVEYDELVVVHDMLEARLPRSARVHEEWDDNVFVETRAVAGDMRAAIARASVHVSRELRTARQCISPLEGRGALAYWDSRDEQLVVWSSTQVPHLIRVGLAECLGLPQRQIRVIAPDVGGGFGYKCVLVPEEVCVAWLALRLGYPVRWIEDRREQLINASCREHHYRMTAHADARGRMLGLEVEASVDSGAYSLYPFSACLECGQLPGMMPGPYRLEALDAVSYGVATNKPPIVPYRGVARPGACLAIESMMDAIAEEVGRDACDVRLENAVTVEAMPYVNLVGKHFDGGDYSTCIRKTAEAIGLAEIRERQRRGARDGRLTGVGFAFFNEQGSVGTAVYAKWGMPFTPGFEQASVRLAPDGALEVRVGIQSHGQGLETSLAQVAHEVLGIDIRSVKIVHGDTALTPFSTGTWGSRSMVMAGGAVAVACRELAKRLATIGAHAMRVAPASARVADGRVSASGRSMTIAEIANLWYATPQDLPPDVHTGGLEVTAGYKPQRDSGTYSYAAHAALVALDSETGHVEVLDYVVVEDGGTLVNPMIVDGQIYGGTAQGIGTGLYEEMPFSEQGQPLATTLLDYVLPGATEIPRVRIIHMETPSPYTEFGVKGIGEGGAIGPPAALFNAVNDALRPLGARVTECPVTPRRVLAAIDAARSDQGALVAEGAA